MPSCSSGIFILDVATVALCESSGMQQCSLLPVIFLVMSVRFVFIVHGTAEALEGLTFVVPQVTQENPLYQQALLKTATLSAA